MVLLLFNFIHSITSDAEHFKISSISYLYYFLDCLFISFAYFSMGFLFVSYCFVGA